MCGVIPSKPVALLGFNCRINEIVSLLPISIFSILSLFVRKLKSGKKTAIYYSLTITGLQLQAYNYRLTITGLQLQAYNYCLTITALQLQAYNYSLTITALQLQAYNYRLTITGLDC